MTVTFIGKSTELSEREFQEAATFLTRDALDSVAVLCEQRRRARSIPSQ
jgi:hypothetical protein